MFNNYVCLFDMNISIQSYLTFRYLWSIVHKDESCLFVCFKGRIALLPDESNPYLHSSPG